MHVQLVDPAAYTPPYDHALATALARAGARVDLITTASAEWDLATDGTDASAALPYERHRDFYRASANLSGPARTAARIASHPIGLRRLRARAADITHLQWAPLQEVDALGLPRRRPLAITAHDILPREARRFQHAAQRAIYGRADLVVAHSEHGRQRLIDEAGVPASKVRVIPHGAFEHLAAVRRAPLPAELIDRPAGRPVVLSFGLIRPYKGTDVLLEAWREVKADAELWIVGKPRGVDLAALQAIADDRVRFVPRFVTDGELAACFDAAQLAVLPYREIEQSGVLATALAFGTPVLASAVGAFPEAERLGAAATVPPADPAALAAAIDRLLADPTERAVLTARARGIARAEWSWETVAQLHLAAYEELLG
ncbi:MAG: glycosyltransferase family 4 protein [Solirubrobacteraceae bacterium]|nr:glycosyltransferase family 4 protein [Solirubrobacteraceae bacterium]